MKDQIGKVFESSPSSILVEIKDQDIFEEFKTNLQIGKYIEISDGNLNKVVCSIQNIKSSLTNDNMSSLRFILATQPIGYIENEKFIKGASLIPSPTEPVYIISEDSINLMFSSNKDFNFPFGKLTQNKIEFNIDPNKFFSKHIAIVGSTGAGKSCTVSKILQDVIGISEGKNIHIKNQKNSHIIIFDIHSEYKSAFDLSSSEKFTLNNLDVSKLKLPYWLMNSSELESLFIEGKENNHHNQVSQFKKAVILNKEKHNPSLKDRITYDTPVFFSIQEVFNYITNINNVTVYAKDGKNYFASTTEEIEYDEDKFWEIIDFESSTGNSKHPVLGIKVSKSGGFNGEFERFISRLETKIGDKRLNFIMSPKTVDGAPFNTDDFEILLKQFLGYLDKANITIIDLSGIPFEVLSITVSLISRLVFDFAFHYTKLKHSEDKQNDIPFIIVCEEAHNYIPKTGGAEYKASKKSIERIAKEGRKYGLSLMVVSQRPSEVSETIFSQCNNFISMRLTNLTDQNYVKGLLPDNSNAVADILPNLGVGECLIVGDATLIPSVVKLEMPNPEPKSQSIKFQDEWQNDWKDIKFNEVINRWKNE